MSVATHTELKALETRKKELGAELDQLRRRAKEIDDEIREKAGKLGAVNQQIEQLKRKENGLIVSEHAIVRYFERVLGYDMEEVKRTICGTDPREVRLDGNITCPVGGTHKIKIRDNTVVTLITKDDQHH